MCIEISRRGFVLGILSSLVFTDSALPKDRVLDAKRFEFAGYLDSFFNFIKDAYHNGGLSYAEVMNLQELRNGMAGQSVCSYVVVGNLRALSHNLRRRAQINPHRPTWVLRWMYKYADGFEYYTKFFEQRCKKIGGLR